MIEDHMINLTKETIQKEEYYSPSQLMRCNIFPWIKSTMTLMAIIKSEKGKELFKPIIRESAKNRRYYIKGEDILNVLDLADKGELKI